MSTPACAHDGAQLLPCSPAQQHAAWHRAGLGDVRAPGRLQVAGHVCTRVRLAAVPRTRGPASATAEPVWQRPGSTTPDGMDGPVPAQPSSTLPHADVTAAGVSHAGCNLAPCSCLPARPPSDGLDPAVPRAVPAPRGAGATEQGLVPWCAVGSGRGRRGGGRRAGGQPASQPVRSGVG